MRSKSQDREVDYAEPHAGGDGEDHAAPQLFVRGAARREPTVRPAEPPA